MSVVGLTLGSGAKAMRPSAASAASVATSASTRELGWLRSYQAKPAASASAEQQEGGDDPAHADHLHAARAQQRGASSGSSAAPPRMRAVCVAKYQPPASTSAVGASATGRPSPSSTVRGGERRGELRVVRGDDDRGALRGEPRRCAASASLCARSIPRVGSSRHSTAGRSPWRTMASASRWRSPPERSRGCRSARSSRPAAASASGGQLVADPLVQRVVAGVLEQQRDPAAALHLARAWARAARRRRAAASTCRRRCGPSARRARRRATSRSTPRRTAAPPLCSNQTPLSASAGARRRARVGRRATRGVCGAAPRQRAAGSARRASLTPTGGGRRPASENSRAPGVCSSGACSPAQSRNARGRRRRRPPRRAGRPRGRRRRGSARAGARRARPRSPTPR